MPVRICHAPVLSSLLVAAKLTAGGRTGLCFHGFRKKQKANYASIEAAQIKLQEDIRHRKQVFEKYDWDNSGALCKKELTLLIDDLGKTMDKETMEMAWREMDRSGDGQVGRDEFERWWREQELMGVNMHDKFQGNQGGSDDEEEDSDEEQDSDEEDEYDSEDEKDGDEEDGEDEDEGEDVELAKSSESKSKSSSSRSKGSQAASSSAKKSGGGGRGGSKGSKSRESKGSRGGGKTDGGGSKRLSGGKSGRGKTSGGKSSKTSGGKAGKAGRSGWGGSRSSKVAVEDTVEDTVAASRRAIAAAREFEAEQLGLDASDAAAASGLRSESYKVRRKMKAKEAIGANQRAGLEDVEEEEDEGGRGRAAGKPGAPQRTGKALWGQAKSKINNGASAAFFNVAAVMKEKQVKEKPAGGSERASGKRSAVKAVASGLPGDELPEGRRPRAGGFGAVVSAKAVAKKAPGRRRRLS